MAVETGPRLLLAGRATAAYHSPTGRFEAPEARWNFHLMKVPENISIRFKDEKRQS